MGVVEPQREVPVFWEGDVVVVGGGPGGIGAALAAARNGAKTVLIERFGGLGGLQTQGNNPAFSFVDPELHGGVIQEIIERLRSEGALKRVEDLPGYERSRFKENLISRLGKDRLPKRLVETDVGYWGAWSVSFDIEYYKYLLDCIVQEAGIKPLYHTLATGALRDGNTLKGVVVETKQGRLAILGKVVVDATGTGDIVRYSGAPSIGAEGIPVGPRKGQHLGALSSFFVGGVDVKRFREFREANLDKWGEMYVGREILEKAKKEGTHVVVDRVILASVFDVYNGGRIWVMTLLYSPTPGASPLSPDEVTRAEIEMRRQARELHRVFKENIPGFENSYIERTANIPLTGMSHRVLGDYVLTVGDMREGRAFDDSVAINNMPPDLYELVGRFRYEILPHDVPYRCLVSREVENLLAAGTTISSGAFAIAGLRYCTPSICQGQAAGTAAALAVAAGVTPRKLDVTTLQATLRRQGAPVSVRDLKPEVLEPYRFIQKLNIEFRRVDTIPISEEEVAKY